MTSTPRKTSAISIIIPTRNEEENITRQAKALASVGCEVVVVDGGSTDATVARAGDAGFRVFSCEPGRARQLNAGAEAASHGILLFLHADCRLPEGFRDEIIFALERQKAIAGAFRLAIESPTLSMRFIASCANLRSRLFALPYGDQAIFTTRRDFHSLGGFPETPIMEDFLFIREARQRGKIIILEKAVITSSRRWRRKGVLKTTFINQLIVGGYYLGIAPDRLRSLYDR